MGIDISYQAIPDDSPALERARHDADFCCELEHWDMHVDHGDYVEARVRAARGSTKPEDIAFVEAVEFAQAAARAHPGIELRRWEWSRGYDAVFYLLSPAYRSGQGDWSEPRDWAGEAIFGAQVLAGTTTIGFKIRYTPPHLLREYAELLRLVTRDDLRQHFEPDAMWSIYKYFGQPEGFENWIWPQFEAWREFLLLMRGFPDEGLLCCVG